jgi:fumarylpyruvate hydrolase
MPHFIMDRYKVDVGKVVCIPGNNGSEGGGCGFYLKPQGALSRDGSEVVLAGDPPEMAFSMMLGVAIGERSTGDPRTVMRSILGLGVMVDHHLRIEDPKALLYELRDPLVSGRDGFCTISDFVPLKDVGDPYGLEVYLQVNEEEWLQMSTRDMPISIEDAITSIGKHITLFPGDLVGIWLDGISRPVEPGDLIEGGISGISTITTKLVREETDRDNP